MPSDGHRIIIPGPGIKPIPRYIPPMTTAFHPSHKPNPIDPIGDPTLMCNECLVCACCAPTYAAQECRGQYDPEDD